LSSVEATPAGSTTAVRKTALNAVHRQMGAKMVDFNGWDMPVEYPASIGGGIINEHLAVRTGVGIFDVSHMGDIRLAGPQALAAVQHISMNDASQLAVGQAQYSALLYPQGTFVDDVIVHRLDENEYLLVINAGTREKDFNWVRDNTRQFDCAVENLSDDFTQIAIQGPKGVDVLQKLTDADLSAVNVYWVTRGSVCRLGNILIARTGYTAEDGFEIYVSAEEATSARVWNEILAAGKEFGIVPCGLGARNTLRLEGKAGHSTGMRYPIRSMYGKPGLLASVRWRRRSSSAATHCRRRRQKMWRGLWSAWRWLIAESHVTDIRC
jgi:aminomethyltransferase